VQTTAGHVMAAGSNTNMALLGVDVAMDGSGTGKS
jgi:hypothetical protein